VSYGSSPRTTGLEFRQLRVRLCGRWPLRRCAAGVLAPPGRATTPTRLSGPPSVGLSLEEPQVGRLDLGRIQYDLDVIRPGRMQGKQRNGGKSASLGAAKHRWRGATRTIRGVPVLDPGDLCPAIGAPGALLTAETSSRCAVSETLRWGHRLRRVAGAAVQQRRDPGDPGRLRRVIPAALLTRSVAGACSRSRIWPSGLARRRCVLEAVEKYAAAPGGHRGHTGKGLARQPPFGTAAAIWAVTCSGHRRRGRLPRYVCPPGKRLLSGSS